MPQNVIADYKTTRQMLEKETILTNRSAQNTDIFLGQAFAHSVQVMWEREHQTI